MMELPQRCLGMHCKYIHETHSVYSSLSYRWQTKPDMTIHGDLYYEGKEFETRLKNKKPGDLSDELRVALGMPTGLVCWRIY